MATITEIAERNALGNVLSELEDQNDALRQQLAVAVADNQRLKNCYYHFKRALGDCAALTTEDEIERIVNLALATEPKK